MVLHILELTVLLRILNMVSLFINLQTNEIWNYEAKNYVRKHKMRKDCLCKVTELKVSKLFRFTVNQTYSEFNFIRLVCKLDLVYNKSKIFADIQFGNFTFFPILRLLMFYITSIENKSYVYHSFRQKNNKYTSRNLI